MELGTLTQSMPRAASRLRPRARTWRGAHASRTAPRRLLEGLADGMIATAPMSAFMLLAQRAGLLGRQPPATITEAAFSAAGEDDAPSPAKKAASAVLHFAFGAAAGAVFAAWPRGPLRAGSRRRRVVREAIAGAAFGSMVWAASYMGWVPALGIMPPAHRDRPDRPWSMIAAHWIYGATLGWRTAARAA